MSRPLAEPSPTKDAARNEWRAKQTERRPLAGRWNTPSLVNGWTQPDPPLGTMQFRIHMDGSLEFKGHLEPGTSGTVAFTLPGAIDEEPDYRPAHDISFLTDVATSTTTFAVARVYIEASSGDVTITFPAS